MNISLSELRQFQKLSSPIVGHNLLPVLEYLRMGDGKIIKSILSAFVEYQCNEASEEMLVDERLFNVKIGSTQSSFLNISKKGNKVTVTDSVTQTTFQVPEVKVFPNMPVPTSERHKISENFMNVLAKAQVFSLKTDPTIPNWLSFIMIGNSYMCASDGHVFFSEPVDETFELVLDKRHAAIISKMPIKEYAYSDEYLFFYTDNATIGFSKSEIKYNNIIKYGHINGSPLEFVASATDIQRFNDECAHSSKFPWVTMSECKLSMNDITLDIQVERSFPTIKPSGKFTYNAETFNRLLAVAEEDEIEFYRGKDWYWVKCPSQKSTMLIMRLAE